MARFKTVLVMFEDQANNYKTPVNGKLTDQEIKEYFINTVFNVGVYPVENMKKCINVEIQDYKE